MAKKSTNRIWRLFILLELLTVGQIIANDEAVPLESRYDNDSVMKERDSALVDKRYLAAMAKNGRLPKFATANKREGSDKVIDDEDFDIDDFDNYWMDEKRHVGAFLKSHGKPLFGGAIAERSVPYNEDDYQEISDTETEKTDKRNVASLARLGRLNAVRFGRFQPQYYSGKKRVHNNDEMNDGAYLKKQNEVIDESGDCEDEDVVFGKVSNNEDNNVYPNWYQSQQKRYVAALARSGRLPIWHPQRMWWGGKRDMPNAYWLRYRSGARPYGEKRKNGIANIRYIKLKSKRCKKSALPAEIPKVPTVEKKNLSMLARKGVLPDKPFVSA